MDPKTKKKLIIGLSVTTILGVGGYFLYKYIKDKNASAGEGDVDSNVVIDNKVTTTIVIPPGASPNAVTTGDRPSQVLVFQKYANTSGYKPALKEDGLWGPKTKAAWVKLKSAYQSQAAVKAQAGQLSGQLKVIYDAFMSADSLKTNTKAYQNNATKLMNVETIGDTSGKKYIYSAGGSMFVYNGAVKVASGNYTNNGLTLVMTFGPGKGQTFTGDRILQVANSASTDPQAQSKLSLVQQADIVAKMYKAMKGPGTWDMDFNKEWNRLRTKQDWLDVFNLFGKKQNASLYQWMSEESDLMRPYNKKKYNDWFKSVGSTTRF